MPEDFPVGRAATQVFFKQEDQVTPTIGRRLPPDLDNPNTCRWCLQRFDPAAQQPRTTWERGQLRTLVDNLKQKAGEAIVVLASAQPEGKVAIIAGVTPDLIKRIQAGNPKAARPDEEED